jgi:hypothetical protein
MFTPAWLIHGRYTRHLLTGQVANDVTSLVYLTTKPGASCPLTDAARDGWTLYADLIEPALADRQERLRRQAASWSDWSDWA